MSAFAATRICSASRISGLTFDDGRRNAGRNLRRKCLLNQRNPACDVLRIIAQQDADRVFFLRDLSLQVRNLRIRSVEHLLRLEHIQFRGHSVLKAQPGKFDRIGLGVDCLTRDRELQVELQEREVVAGHIADQGQCDDLACVLRCQKLGASCFIGAAQATEEIQLERRVRAQGQEVVSGLFEVSFPPPKFALPVS